MIFYNNKPLWLKIILAFLVISLLTGYFIFIKNDIKKTKEKSFMVKKEEKTGVVIKKLSDEVDHGLYEIKIDDSTTILLYRGVESCTMIKK